MGSLKRIQAILIKEVQDIRSNSNIMVMYLMPILFTYIWENFIPEMPAGFGAAFGLIFLVVMVGMYVPSMLIAEEKEKNTMEVLMLSPARPIEIFVGKGLLTIFSIIIISFVIALMVGMSPINLLIIIIATTLTSTFAIFVGMIVGLISPNQMSTGVVGLPVYLLLLLIPQLSGMGVTVVDFIARFLPTYYFLNILELTLIEGVEISDLYFHLSIISISSVIILGVLLYIYRKKGLLE
ncbi:MAG: ABC transporter permease [Halarsenatibacteraceae bacterium]